MGVEASEDAPPEMEEEVGEEEESRRGSSALGSGWASRLGDPFGIMIDWGVGETGAGGVCSTSAMVVIEGDGEVVSEIWDRG